MPVNDDDVTARLDRIESKLDRQASAPTGFSAAQRLRAAYKRSADAAAAVREDGGGVADQNAAMREANR